MSIDWQYDLVRLHRLLCPEQVGETPQLLEGDVLDLRLRLLDEEFGEMRSALVNGDLAGAVDGMVDTIVVILGTAVAMGVEVGSPWDAVQASNVAKAGGGRRADGKWLKGPNWKAPDIEGILGRQRPLSEIYPEAEVSVP